MLASSESLLQLLQRFIQHPNQIKQIHSFLVVNRLLLKNLQNSSPWKWRTTLLYNALIRAYLNISPPRCTLQLFTQMLAHGAIPNSHTFPPLFKLVSSPCRPLHSQAFKRGVLVDPFVQTSLLGVYGKLGHLNDACKVFEEILNPCIVACNAMLDAFGRNGDVGSAVSLFESMRERDVVSWTSVINGFLRSGRFSDGIQVFEKMVTVGEAGMGCLVKPNEATFVSVLSCCANLDGGIGLYQGKQIHGYVVRNEALTVYTGTALIDFYGKTGCLESARKIFSKMIAKKVCTWNAMISSLASSGKEEEALNMFENMKLEGVHPNEVTFVAVLTACARINLVEFGLELFKSMVSKYGVLPVMEHYGCVVDLLGRAGLLNEATEIIRTMPFQPDGSVFGALLGACKIHGAIELGNEVGKRLLELQPQHCGQYVLLSSLNADLERWDRAADLRKAMVEAGIRKIPAYSLTGSISFGSN
ncbi:hypothetical protein SLE2022_344820 [Rubroshorea leprosula]